MDHKYNNQIIALMYMILILAATRLLTLELFQFLSDGIGALMVYFYLVSRGKCMAILLLINGIMGLFIGLSRTFQIYSYEEVLGFTFFPTLILIFSIYSVIVYSYEIYLSIIGINRYNWEFGGNRLNNATYTEIPSNQQPTAQRGFVPFSGRGTTIS